MSYFFLPQSQTVIPFAHHHFRSGDSLRQQRPNFSLEATLLSTFSLCAAMLNGLILAAVMWGRLYRPLFLCVASIGLCDLLLSVIYVPCFNIFVLTRSMIPNLFFCRYLQQAAVILISISISSKLLIAIHCHFLMRQARAKEQKTRHKAVRPLFEMAAIWGFNILFFGLPPLLPTLLGGLLQRESLEANYMPPSFFPNDAVCANRTSKAFSPALVAFGRTQMAFHMLQILLTVAFLGRIGLAISSAHFKRCGGVASTDSSTQLAPALSRQQRRAAEANAAHYLRAKRTVWCLLAVDLICWVPLSCLNLALYPNFTLAPRAVRHIIMDSLFLGCLARPIIFLYGLRALRTKLGAILACTPFGHSSASNKSAASSSWTADIITLPTQSFKAELLPSHIEAESRL